MWNRLNFLFKIVGNACPFCKENCSYMFYLFLLVVVITNCFYDFKLELSFNILYRNLYTVKLLYWNTLYKNNLLNPYSDKI